MRRFISVFPALIVLAACIAATLAAPAIVRQLRTSHTQAKITLATQVLESDDVLAAIDRATIAIADLVRPSLAHLEVAVGRDGGFGRSSGSAWVYNDEGYLITNAHVVRGARIIEAQFADGRIGSATLIGDDPFTDIAVVKLDDPGTLFPLTRDSNAVPQQGQRVYAFGSPFGFKFSMSEGIISGLGRDPANARDFGGFTNYIQTDAAVNPGNSGGPLVDIRGRLIGMNVAIATARDSQGTNEGDSAGISFAIPVAPIESVVTQLIERGEVARGFLGISFIAGAVERVETDDEVYNAGVRVNFPVEDGPSDRAGIKAGDVVVSINDQPITSYNVLRSIVAVTAPGETLDVVVVREGEAIPVGITLDEMPVELLAENAGALIMGRLGIGFAGGPDAQRNPGQPIISVVIPDSSAEAIGFRAGQRIVAAASRSVDSLAELYRQLYDNRILSGNTIPITVIPQGGSIEDAERLRLRFDY